MAMAWKGATMIRPVCRLLNKKTIIATKKNAFYLEINDMAIEIWLFLLDLLVKPEVKMNSFDLYKTKWILQKSFSVQNSVRGGQNPSQSATLSQEQLLAPPPATSSSNNNHFVGDTGTSQSAAALFSGASNNNNNQGSRLLDQRLAELIRLGDQAGKNNTHQQQGQGEEEMVEQVEEEEDNKDAVLSYLAAATATESICAFCLFLKNDILFPKIQ